MNIGYLERTTNKLTVFRGQQIQHWLHHRIRWSALFVVFFLSNTNVKAQAGNNNGVVDSINYTISWDSSIIRIEKTVTDKEFWINILSHDGNFINFFKTNDPRRACYVYVASIEKDSPFSYTFSIYCRPLNIKPNELSGFGYARYMVKLAPQANHGYKIYGIKLIGLSI